MIGKAIIEILSGYTGFTALVDTKIYPLVLPEDTDLPAAVYAVESVSPLYSKTGWVQDDVVFRVVSYSKKYSEALDVADQARDALELTEGIYDSVDIQKIYMTGQDEFFQIDANVFIIRQTFNVFVNHNK